MGTNLDVPKRHDRTHTDNEAVVQDRPPAFERLKPGPGKSPDQVRASQRDRLHRAMIELAADEGYERVTVRALTRKAGISTRAFYGHYSNREECLAASVDRVGHELLESVDRKAPGTREQRFQAGLHTVFADLAAEPKAAKALFVEAPSSSRPVRTRAECLTADLERLLAGLLAAENEPPGRIVLAIAAGVVRVATMTTLTGRLAELPDLAPRLSDWALGIYGRREKLAAARPGKPRQDDGRRREPSPLPASLSAIDGTGEYERILSAVSRVALANGYAGLTVSKIRREAGVSRRRFDERFTDANSCFLAAVESLAGRAAHRAVAWAAAGGTGKFNVRTVLALCAIGARNQRQAELVLATILAPGRDGLRCREKLISEAAAWLSTEGRIGQTRGSLEAEASVAAIWRVAQREIHDGRAQALPRCAALFYALLS